VAIAWREINAGLNSHEAISEVICACFSDEVFAAYQHAAKTSQ
jgi:hypothetical protein